jgi:PilX N-terminal
MERWVKEEVRLERRACESGSILVVALIVLVLLTVIGIAATQVSELELGMSANWNFEKKAFYAAESAGNFVARSPGLYGTDNMTVGTPKTFQSATGLLGPDQSFDGTVEYLGASTPPRGSGFETNTFRVYRYRMLSNGYGPSGAKAAVEVGFYRIGF